MQTTNGDRGFCWIRGPRNAQVLACATTNCIYELWEYVLTGLLTARSVASALLWDMGEALIALSFSDDPARPAAISLALMPLPSGTLESATDGRPTCERVSGVD